MTDNRFGCAGSNEPRLLELEWELELTLAVAPDAVPAPLWVWLEAGALLVLDFMGVATAGLVDVLCG